MNFFFFFFFFRNFHSIPKIEKGLRLRIFLTCTRNICKKCNEIEYDRQRICSYLNSYANPISKIFFAPFLHKFIEYRIIMLIIAKIYIYINNYYAFVFDNFLNLNESSLISGVEKNVWIKKNFETFETLFPRIILRPSGHLSFFLFFNRELTISEIDPLSQIGLDITETFSWFRDQSEKFP